MQSGHYLLVIFAIIVLCDGQLPNTGDNTCFSLHNGQVRRSFDYRLFKVIFHAPFSSFSNIDWICLHQAAYYHNQKQAEYNQMSHQLPGEPALGDRVTAQGVPWSAVAENVGYASCDGSAIFTAWMNSAAHKTNIMNTAYNAMAVSSIPRAAGGCWWTAVFAG